MLVLILVSDLSQDQNSLICWNQDPIRGQVQVRVIVQVWVPVLVLVQVQDEFFTQAEVVV